jgi:hypothetical protein
MKESQPLQISHRSLAFIWLLTVSSLIGFIVWKILDSRPSIQIELTEVTWIGGGQDCPIPLYDAQGNAHEGMVWGNIDYLTYKGPAPLYGVDPSNYPNESNGNPCWYPEKISSDIAVKGYPVYPMLLKVNLLNNTYKMRKGESTKLSAEAYLLDQFPGGPPENSVLFVVDAEATSVFDVYFSLDTTNFRFTPPNESAIISPLSISHPTRQEWIISPEENTLGEQLLGVAVNDSSTKNDLAGSMVSITVSDISGLNPSIASLLSAIGTFLLGLFAILKIIPETLTLYFQPRSKKKSQS